MSRRARIAIPAATAAAALAGAALLLSPGGAASVAECRGGDAVDFACQERRYVELADTRGAAAALDDLAKSKRDSGFLRAACHQLTHRIGRTAGADDGIDAFGDGDAVCGSGYYHGVTEAAMRRVGARAATRQPAGVCATRRGRERADCIHGMGHGYMGVLERDLRASLEGCDALRASRDRQGCYSGVFMENTMAAGDPDPDSLRPRDPLYPCAEVARRYREACYERQSTYALFVNDGDFRAVFGLCADVERASRGSCHRGLGGDAAAETKDIEDLARQARTRRGLCMLADTSEARSACVAGAARVILQDLDGGPEQLDALCTSFDARVTQPQHAACLEASERAYRELLAEQTGGGPGGEAPAAAPDFVCHLEKAGRQPRSERK